MIFDLQRNPALPRLAWLARLRPGLETIEVICGADVEAGDDWFFEGAWAGDFGAGAFLETSCFGTGGRIGPEGVTFAPPDHILDRLILIEHDDGLLVSNSLPFALERAGARLLADTSDYPVWFGNIRHGLTDHSQDTLPLQDGRTVTLWAWHHLHLAPDLTVSSREKMPQVPTTDYSAYTGYLSDQIGAVARNADDPARRSRFKLMTTLSSGYDSTAISALAADHGCRDAITFARTRAKMGKAAQDDSGRVAGERLGITVHEYDRLGYRQQDGLPEIETLGAGAEMSAARDRLEGSVLLTGYMGDTMWDREPKAVSTFVYWPVIAGHNFTELRLAAGFAHLCVPFIGCRQQPEIIAISQSDEMADWRLNTDYDRPICRRIAEERGIPREAFGLAKRATGVFFREEGLAATMTPASYADYSDFRDEHSGVPAWQARLGDRWIRFARFFNGATGKLARRIGLKASPVTLPATPGRRSEGALLFQWSIARLKERYKVQG